jgi:hypothetical protein
VSGFSRPNSHLPLSFDGVIRIEGKMHSAGVLRKP